MDRPIDRLAPEVVVLPVSLSQVWANRLFLAVILAEGAFLRLWQIGYLGYNTDEAVYSGTAAAIAGDPALAPYFPIFRAHPLLSQFILAILYHWGVNDWIGRVEAVAFGLVTVFITFKIGELLYGPKAGLVAALILALMPFHVIVSRQFLLDGPMTTMATLTLYMLARYARSGRSAWLIATGIGMGLVFLAKETGIVMVAAIYAFLALSPELRVRIRDVVLSLVVMAAALSPFPLSLMMAQTTKTGNNYLVWQLFRRPNHDPSFYLQVLPAVIDPWVLIAVALSLVLYIRQTGWKEKLLMLWILVPVLFFQLWPVKGFQYMLPIVVPLSVLAGRLLGGVAGRAYSAARSRWNVSLLRAAAIAALSVVLLTSSWSQLQASFSDRFTAGTGGVPGGREAGLWVKDNVPQNATMMALGPSMANIIQFYGQRKVLGLSVSSNPLHRNPSYEPIINPDVKLRNGEIQYVIWDSYSAARSSFFSQSLLNYVKKYHGRVVHVETLNVTLDDGSTAPKDVITIYEVRP